jgi:signal peptidase I
MTPTYAPATRHEPDASSRNGQARPALGARLRRSLIDWVRTLLIVGVVLGTFRSTIADWYDVPTGSMNPTIIEGDRILVNKLAFGVRVPFSPWWIAQWGEPRRGDIVILYSPKDGARLVKRVIGVPGDAIEMTRNRLTINGGAVEYAAPESWMPSAMPSDRRGRHTYATEMLPGRAHAVLGTPGVMSLNSFGPITIPAGQFFVMGDNRDLSADSRIFGLVPRDRIVGRASAVAVSLDRDHWYRPRWERFLGALR